MQRKLLILVFLTTSLAIAKEAGPKSQVLIDREEGFIICSGGTSSPLFSKDCKKLLLHRISAGGGISYEGTCEDNNGKLFFLACQGISFEYQRKANSDQKTYWEKSNENRSEGP